MPRKRPNRPELLEAKLSELTDLIKDLSPEARVEIVFARYEDEDAAIDVYPPVSLQTEEVRRLEQALGERCNDILVETGLFIIAAVQD
ncbi:MAG TPA: hypothetical protein VGX03_27060 [Candidatus Binatia bacterium]|jgi:hypothetical protein|nr:hypothetical protein [Candidatus Binatia bacterium]